MAAGEKKSRAGPEPPPIEGEIVTGETAAGGAAPDAGNPAGRRMLRRLVWILAAVGAVFIGGIMAAPYITGGIASLFGGSEPIAVSVPTSPAPPVEAMVPEPIAHEPEPGAVAPAGAGGDGDDVSGETAGNAGSDFARLEGRVAALEEAADGSPEAGAEVAARLAALEARLDLLELIKVAAPAAPEALRVDIDQRIDALEERLAVAEATGAGADRMLLALARLSQRAQAGRAFAGEMLELRTLVDAIPADARAAIETHAAVLAGHAAKGVKSIAMLQRDFGAALPAVLEAAALAGEAGWWAKAWAQLKGVVVVRRTGEVEGPGIGAILARAEFYLSQDNVAAALAETEALEAVAQEPLAAWRAAAADALAVRRALEALIALSSRPHTDAAAEGD